jgi:hypothetical protein
MRQHHYTEDGNDMECCGRRLDVGLILFDVCGYITLIVPMSGPSHLLGGFDSCNIASTVTVASTLSPL